MEKENIIRFDPGKIKDNQTWKYDWPSNGEMATPTLSAISTILSPDLCKVIYASGKFNKFIPAYFWKVGNSPEYKSYGLINNCKEFWDKEVDEMEGGKPLPIIPAYTSSELLAMLPKTVTPMGEMAIYHLTQTTYSHGDNREYTAGYFRYPASLMEVHSLSEVESRGHLLIKLIEQSLV